MSSKNPRRCTGTKLNGEPCQSPFVGEDGRCVAHRPGGREEQRRRARRGGKATRRRYQGLRGEKFLPDELPDLDTVADARVWLRRAAEGVATGRLSAKESQAITDAVKQFIQLAREEPDSEASADSLDSYVREKYADADDSEE